MQIQMQMRVKQMQGFAGPASQHLPCVEPPRPNVIKHPAADVHDAGFLHLAQQESQVLNSLADPMRSHTWRLMYRMLASSTWELREKEMRIRGLTNLLRDAHLQLRGTQQGARDSTSCCRNLAASLHGRLASQQKRAHLGTGQAYDDPSLSR